jgi:hypothetical protein
MPGMPGGPHPPPFEEPGNQPGDYHPPGEEYMPPGDEEDLEPALSSLYFLTGRGAALNGEAYQRHLAITFADDREAVLTQVKTAAYGDPPPDYPITPDDEWNRRIDALKPFTEYGPKYVRGVRDGIYDANRSHEYAKNSPSEQWR